MTVKLACLIYLCKEYHFLCNNACHNIKEAYEAKAKWISSLLAEVYLQISFSQTLSWDSLREEWDVHVVSFTNLKSSQRREYFKLRQTSQSVTVKLSQSHQPAVDEKPSVWGRSCWAWDEENRPAGRRCFKISRFLCFTHTLALSVFYI